MKKIDKFAYIKIVTFGPDTKIKSKGMGEVIWYTNVQNKKLPTKKKEKEKKQITQKKKWSQDLNRNFTQQENRKRPVRIWKSA